MWIYSSKLVVLFGEIFYLRKGEIMIKDIETKNDYITVDSIAAKEIENYNCITGDTN